MGSRPLRTRPQWILREPHRVATTYSRANFISNFSLNRANFYCSRKSRDLYVYFAHRRLCSNSRKSWGRGLGNSCRACLSWSLACRYRWSSRYSWREESCTRHRRWWKIGRACASTSNLWNKGRIVDRIRSRWNRGSQLCTQSIGLISKILCLALVKETSLNRLLHSLSMCLQFHIHRTIKLPSSSASDLACHPCLALNCATPSQNFCFRTFNYHSHQCLSLSR